MVEPIELATSNQQPIPRLNRIPILIALVLVVTFLAVVFYGLSSRGLRFGTANEQAASEGSQSASRFGDQMTKGVPDGIIGEPSPIVTLPIEMPSSELAPEPEPAMVEPAIEVEPEANWRARLEREEAEQVRREFQRQRMASIQADEAAYDSPIAVDLGTFNGLPQATSVGPLPVGNQSAIDPLRLALANGGGVGTPDPNGQAAKARFLSEAAEGSGYLDNAVSAPLSRYELKRGSVIPATLITGINSDLPGMITAQVSQNVFDSATGRHLLIPQGSRLLGRYDSEISLGQDRVLVVWTDLVLPDGSTLRIANMAGTDQAGASGFSGEVDGHFFETFGSAILVALLGAGTEMMLPANEESRAQASLRQSTGEGLADLANQSTSKGLAVQPTIRIAPGYRFNIIVNQDVIFAQGPRR